MLSRFTGSVEEIGPVDVGDVVAWIVAIPFQEWHQQSRTELRPAMMTDLAWHGFGSMVAPVVADLMEHFPGCHEDQRMLSVVMPGHSIPPHTDSQPPHWLCRVHVPLTTNEQSRFIVGGMTHHLEPGRAYRVNTEAVHSVENAGTSPRINFMFDVRRHA